MYKITSLNNEGLGITRVDNKVVFVPYSAIGDVIDLKIIEDKRNYSIGEITDIKEKSNSRREASCPYYYICGGCNLMHIKYKNQLEFKKEKVINNLKHISNIEIKDISIESDNEYNYRNHIILRVDKNRIGFYKSHSNEIVDIKYCLISNEIINIKIDEIRDFLNKYKDNNINKISIKAFNGVLINIVSDDFTLMDEFIKYVKVDSLYINNELVYKNKSIKFKFDKFNFMVSNNSFFQKNTDMALKLYYYIKENIDDNSKILDLYSGIGSIGIFVADKCKSVLGVEIIESAVDNAKENSKINNINNIEFICGKVEDNLDNIKDIDTIIVDPPRVGLNKKAIENINKINPKKIIYVSCNSTTLARDINYLNYEIKSIKLFDLFPNTHHVEIVVVLKRKTI